MGALFVFIFQMFLYIFQSVVYIGGMYIIYYVMQEVDIHHIIEALVYWINIGSAGYFS